MQRIRSLISFGLVATLSQLAGCSADSSTKCTDSTRQAPACAAPNSTSLTAADGGTTPRSTTTPTSAQPATTNTGHNANPAPTPTTTNGNPANGAASGHTGNSPATPATPARRPSTQPAPGTPSQPAPSQPVPGTPAPGTPAQPAPSQPVPGTPATGTPAQPAPGTPSQPTPGAPTTPVPAPTQPSDPDVNNSSIQVTLPDTQVVDGTLVNITWLSRGLATSELLQISVSGDNGETWTELEASVLNTGTFAWHVAAPVGDEYKVRLTLLKNPAIYGDSGTFSVLAAPTLNPEGGSADKSTKSGADPK